MTASKRPLMAVDGDSLAHRAYHGLPKTISRAGGRPAGALVGFSNFLMRLWDVEQPRAVVVGWDTLESPTYRHEELPGYQAGRVFDDALLEQLAMLPELVEAFGFRVGACGGLRGRRLPRGGGSRGGEAAWHVRRRHLGPRRVPARLGADDDPQARERRLRARPGRSRQGGRALRRRAGAGDGLHRAARRSRRTRSPARRASARRPPPRC